jgi:O-antigen/teichoic acid export membrane protein
VSSNIIKLLKISTFTTVINGALGLSYYLIAAKLLSPAEFGVFFLTTSFIVVIADIADFGMDSGIINFVSKHKDQKGSDYLRTALLYKILIGAAASVLIFLSASFISEVIFQKNTLKDLLQYGSLGVLGMLLFAASTSYLQAMQKLKEWSVILIGSNLFRLLIVGYLYLNNSLTPLLLVLTYVLIPYVFWLLSFVFLPVIDILKFNFSNKKELLSFSFFVGLTDILWAGINRLDTFILGRIVDTTSLGLYGFAAQFTVVVPQFISALVGVIGPQFAAIKTKEEKDTLVSKLTFVLLILILLGLITLPVVGYLWAVFFPQYEGSYFIFVILILASVMTLIATPLHESLRYFSNRPGVFIYIYGIQLTVLLLGGLYFGNISGIFGMSIAVLLSSLSNLITSYYFYQKINKS